MTETNDDSKYDVFISYSHRDEEWVRSWLLPRLEEAGLRVCIDFRDFEPGALSIMEMERAVLRSRKTLLVLTPDYVASEWTEFENIMAATLDPAARQRRVIPLVLRDCELPLRLRTLTYIDFTRSDRIDFQSNRLLAAIDIQEKSSSVSVARSTVQVTDYNLRVIREFLTAAFDDEELTTLCFDHFRNVYEEFSAGMSKRQKIQRMIAYCERHLEWERLLTVASQWNPAQYSRFASRFKI
jgi:hypothetical protein